MILFNLNLECVNLFYTNVCITVILADMNNLTTLSISEIPTVRKTPHTVTVRIFYSMREFIQKRFTFYETVIFFIFNIFCICAEEDIDIVIVSKIIIFTRVFANNFDENVTAFAILKRNIQTARCRTAILRRLQKFPQ